MNPKTINDLDPKLRETYERVMGTSTTPPASAEPPKIEVQPEPQLPEPQSQAIETQPPQLSGSGTASQIFRADDSSAKKDKQTSTVLGKDGKKAKTKLPIPLLIGLGVVIFFAAYAVIWAKLLGLF